MTPLIIATMLSACSGSTGSTADAEQAVLGQQQQPSAQLQPGTQPSASGLPSSHVHGVGIDPADGLLYLATHDGLFRYEPAGPVRIGPVNDLMGFTIAGPAHYYASGHPGAGSDLPDPVGLIESRDGGQTWEQLSRQGLSDFHALTVSSGAVVGYDGTLRTSSDGATWTSLRALVQPFALTSSPDGAVLLATSEDGTVRSGDAGRTWSRIADAPLLLLVAWASGTQDTVVGVTPDGQVLISTDAGLTWSEQGRVEGTPQALSATGDSTGGVQVQVVNDTTVLTSADGGRTFVALPVATVTGGTQ
jgi:photosystem II stability/assembly factor-like uncharacterized protein